MQIVIEDSEIRRVVGGGAYTRGLAYAQDGRVLTRRWDDTHALLSGTVRGSGRSTYTTSVRLLTSGTGATRIAVTSCSCPVGTGCKHAVALLLHDRTHPAADTVADAAPAALTAPARANVPRTAAPAAPALVPAWQRVLDAALDLDDAGSRGGTALGLQLELLPATDTGARRPASAHRIGLRPVVRSARGRWVRTGISWSDVTGGHNPWHDDQHVAALGALHALLTSSTHDRYGGYYYSAEPRVYLDDAPSRAVWDALTDLRNAGVVLVHARADSAPVTLLDEPATVLVDLRRDEHGLTVSPSVLIGDEPLAPHRFGFIGGATPTGVYWWSAADDTILELKHRLLSLARFAEPLTAEATTLLRSTAHALDIPAAQAPQFLATYYPRLAARMPVGSRDGSVELPAPPHAVLLLTVRVGAAHVLDLDWAWDYRAHDGTPVERVGLWPVHGERSWRSTADEERVLAAVTGPGGVLDALTDASRTALLDGEPGPAPGSAAGRGPAAGSGPGSRSGPAATAAGSTAGRDPGPSPAHGERPGTGLRRLAAHSTLTQWDTVEIASVVLPALRALPDVEVVVVGDLVDYRPAQGEPQVAVATAPSAAHATTRAMPAASAAGTAEPLAQDRDWFELAVTVHVDDRPVPLAPLLVALAAGDQRLLLPDGLWLRIDTPALAGLRALLEEARALQDSPTGPLRLSRFQAGMWAELEALGVVVEQAEAWQQAVADVRRLEVTADDVPVPAAVHAELRAYQRAGFGWLARLTDAGLGGVLADDMGLGKTLQVLALAARLRLGESGAVGGPGDVGGPDTAGRPDAGVAAPPLLVVAPTSVVGNWAVEATKFVPDLRVCTIDRTRAKRGTALADLAADADVIVTSYALFRIEFDDYAALDWSVLVLDEAQMVKNHESRTYACAKQLPARVKIAITGTPLENTVMELWALLGIVAPGLFPSPRRFTDYYRTPIERDGDGERLELLRRRIRPLVLRRTKEQVASDLPPRLEHIVDVELAPRHRAVYDRHLNRERQKVLGLLADFDGNRFEIFRSLMLLRRLALDPSLVDDKHAGVPASKLDVLDSMLEEIVADGHRVLVFSQFTGVLDRVRTRLDTRGTAHCYLDGTTRRRAQVVERFRTGDAPVFLISLKAGGFGLTLTEADYVIVLDPWWNPAVEAQAVDRVHRIGQTRTVMVYRLVATGTIEEKVMALKEGKARLFDSVMGGGELADTRLSAADVRALLE